MKNDNEKKITSASAATCKRAETSRAEGTRNRSENKRENVSLGSDYSTNRCFGYGDGSGPMPYDNTSAAGASRNRTKKRDDSDTNGESDDEDAIRYELGQNCYESNGGIYTKDGRYMGFVMPNPVGYERKAVTDITALVEKCFVNTENAEKFFVPVDNYSESVTNSGLTDIFSGFTQVDFIGGRIAKNIRQLRAFRNLTMEKLAEMAGVTRQYISQIENEDRIPKFEVLCDIAAVFKIHVGLLISLDIPNHYIFLCEILFNELSKKDESRQIDILKGAIKYIENA